MLNVWSVHRYLRLKKTTQMQGNWGPYTEHLGMGWSSKYLVKLSSHDLTPNGRVVGKPPTNGLIAGNSRLVKYYNLARSMTWCWVFVGEHFFRPKVLIDVVCPPGALPCVFSRRPGVQNTQRIWNGKLKEIPYFFWKTYDVEATMKINKQNDQQKWRWHILNYTPGSTNNSWLENEAGLKMYVLFWKNVDVPASYVSLPGGYRLFKAS